MKNVSEQKLKNVLPNKLKELHLHVKQNRTNQVFTPNDSFVPPSYAADPSTTTPGIYYNTTTNKYRAYVIGTGWVNMF